MSCFYMLFVRVKRSQVVLVKSADATAVLQYFMLVFSSLVDAFCVAASALDIGVGVAATARVLQEVLSAQVCVDEIERIGR